MSKIQTKLASVKVTKGEGVGEGDFELQLEVNGDGGSVTWPAPGSTAKVDNSDRPLPIDEVINTYTVNAPVTKQYKIHAREVDSGFNGGDDEGDGYISFDLNPTMQPATKSTKIDIKGHRMGKPHGQIEVTMTAAPL